MTMTLWTVTGFPAGAIKRGTNAMSIAAADASSAITIAQSVLSRNGMTAAYNLTARAE